MNGYKLYSKKTFCAIQNVDGKLIGDGSVSTDLDGLKNIRKRDDLRPGTKVGLETGTCFFYVVRLLAELEFEPVMIYTHEVREIRWKSSLFSLIGSTNSTRKFLPCAHLLLLVFYHRLLRPCNSFE